MRQVLLSPFYRWGNRGAQKLSKLLVITTKHSSPGVWTQTVCPTLEPLNHDTACPVGHQLPHLQIYPVTLNPHGNESSPGFQWLASGKQAHVFKMPSHHHSPQVPRAGSSWPSLLSSDYYGPGSMGCVLYRSDHASFCFMGQLLTACEGNTGMASKRTFLEETALSVCRHLFKFQTLVFRTHICSGHMYCDRWKQKWFSVVSVLLDLTHHPNSKERVEN